MRKLEGKWIMKKEMRMISKDGTISKFLGYASSKEEEEEDDEEVEEDKEEEEDEKEEEEKENEESEKKGSKEASEIGSNSEPPGYAAFDNEVESDLESTARSEPKFKEMEDTSDAKLTQVTNNVNNANANGGNGRNGNGRNNVCSYKALLACNPRDYDGKGGAVALTRWIEKMESVIENSRRAKNQKVKYAASSFINKALTWWNTQVQARSSEAAINMSWVDFMALRVEEFCPSNKMDKLESEF
ncbi:hypothetical protein Tco_1213517 [Tanacetum coccineum]